MSAYKDTILITGGTTGVGFEIARAVAKAQPQTQVIIASRSPGNDAAGKINHELDQSNVKFLPLDLMSLSNVRDFASAFFESGYSPISTLVLNAGLQFPGPIEYNEANVEKTFAVNHLGNAEVFYLLKDHLTANARIIVTSSGTHDPEKRSGMPDAKYTTATEMAHPDKETATKDGRQRYTNSKLCNVLWTYALDRHIKEAGKAWTAIALCPGLMPGTGLARQYSAPLRFLWNYVLPRLVGLLRVLFKTPHIYTAEESGKLIAELVVGKSDNLVSGAYYEGGKESKSSKDSFNEKNQEDLWNYTIKTLARDEVEARSFEV